jgi:CheY-like chemotaxis protein/HPt (histidine-containing phosphotransfer) domain-containing protein
LLQREIERLGFHTTTLNIDQLIGRQPAELFAAGNNTVVFTDYRELLESDHKSVPVVTRWILLAPLGTPPPQTLPNWLSYADSSWLSRPIRRQELEAALFITDTVETPGIEEDIAIGRTADVLLVEDSPISQTVLRDMLAGLGHRVRLANNGRAAVDACKEKLFDLVLMDIQMPGIDGLDATRQIRQAEQGLGRHQKIFALTAHATASDRTMCVEAGMEGFLVKPITLDQLAHAVTRALQGEILLDEIDNETVETPVAANSHETPGHLPSTQLTSGESTSRKSTSRKSTVGDPTSREATSPTSIADRAGADSDQAPDSFSLSRAFEDTPSWEELVAAMNDNENLLRDVLNLLIREAPKLGRTFSKSVEQNQCGEARRAVHTLKSNARYVKLLRIAAYAEQIESLARDEQLEALSKHRATIRNLSLAMADWAEKMLQQQ